MYNRYTPQNDGSFRRNRVQESRQATPRQSESAPPPPCPEPDNHEPERHSQRREASQSPMGFFRQLLPKDFDTGDLIVVLLLLLIAGDSEEDRSNAILTLALYFIM